MTCMVGGGGCIFRVMIGQHDYRCAIDLNILFARSLVAQYFQSCLKGGDYVSTDGASMLLAHGSKPPLVGWIILACQGITLHYMLI
jgi:hypothetical protein